MLPCFASLEKSKNGLIAIWRFTGVFGNSPWTTHPWILLLMLRPAGGEHCALMVSKLLNGIWRSTAYVDRVMDKRFRECLSIAQERHKALNWLMGLEPVYSLVETNT